MSYFYTECHNRIAEQAIISELRRPYKTFRKVISDIRLDSFHHIKVADFGLAEDIYSYSYFKQNDDGVKLPLKWMAPESIIMGRFAEKSDVVR